MNVVPIARLWHKKGKLEYHTMIQLLKYFPDLEFEYHIVLDQFDYKDEWSEKIDKLPVKSFWYSKEDMHDYLKNSGYGIDNDKHDWNDKIEWQNLQKTVKIATRFLDSVIDAKGDLVAGTGADTFSRLAVGANDTVLTADSAQATGLKWATVSAGGLTLISTTSLSGTQTNLTSIPGTYKSLLLRVTGSYGSTSGNLTFRFNNDATNPAYAVNSSSAFQTGYSISGLGGTSITTHYCFNTSVGTTNIVELYLPNYASTATKKYAMIQGATRQNGTSNIDLGLMSAYWDNTSAVTQINILGLGTFTAGTALLYGVN